MTNLRKLAEAATPGPWRSEAWDLDTVIVWPQRGEYVAKLHSDNRGTDAAYIAAASPDAVLALLDVLDAARVVCDPMVAGGGGDRWWDAHAALEAAVAKVPA